MINLNFLTAVGELATGLSYSVVTALREAITSARKNAGIKGWFDIGKFIILNGGLRAQVS